MHHEGPITSGALVARFQAVETWIFDLDNTLYPPHSDLWPKVDQKITNYVGNLLGVDGLTARAIQKYYLSGAWHDAERPDEGARDRPASLPRFRA